jgi:hypothetical protein
MEKLNKTVQEILTEMCKRVGADASTIDFTKEQWFMEYSWTMEEEKAFKEWLRAYLLEDEKRLIEVAKFPKITRNNKKVMDELLDLFMFNYGWRYKEGEKL